MVADLSMCAPGPVGDAPLMMSREVAASSHKTKRVLLCYPGKPLLRIWLKREQAALGTDHHIVPLLAVLDTNDVNAVNDKPVAAADLAYATAEDTPLVLAVLGNDTDVDGPLPLAVARIGGTAVTVNDTVAVTGGSVHVNADGTLTFTPTLNFNGTASFNYTPKDGAGLEAAAAGAGGGTGSTDRPAVVFCSGCSSSITGSAVTWLETGGAAGCPTGRASGGCGVRRGG